MIILIILIIILTTTENIVGKILKLTSLCTDNFKIESKNRVVRIMHFLLI
jgi:hypothetical protein